MTNAPDLSRYQQALKAAVGALVEMRSALDEKAAEVDTLRIQVLQLGGEPEA